MRYRPTDDIGVHLTLNCEYEAYRCGPDHPRAVAAQRRGRLPAHIADLWEHADPEEVLRECRAQIERALAWGIDVTHLAPHLTAITLRPEFFDVYLELAVEFRLPDPPAVDDHGRPGRLPVPPAGRRRGRRLPRPLRPRLARRQPRAGVRRDRATCSRASPRSTCSRPSTRPRSGRSPTPHAGWIDDLALVTDDPQLEQLLADSGATLIGYRELRDAMRAG